MHEEELFGPAEGLHSTYRMIRDEVLEASWRAGSALSRDAPRHGRGRQPRGRPLPRADQARGADPAAGRRSRPREAIAAINELLGAGRHARAAHRARGARRSTSTCSARSASAAPGASRWPRGASPALEQFLPRRGERPRRSRPRTSTSTGPARSSTSSRASSRSRRSRRSTSASGSSCTRCSSASTRRRCAGSAARAVDGDGRQLDRLLAPVRGRLAPHGLRRLRRRAAVPRPRRRRARPLPRAPRALGARGRSGSSATSPSRSARTSSAAASTASTAIPTAATS